MSEEKTTIFIDTQDMEERYSEELYKEYLEKEKTQLQNNWNELKKWLEENWQQSQDIWFVKIINKMQELENKQCRMTSE